MSALTLTLHQPQTTSVDMSPLTPDLLSGKNIDEIARIELAVGKRRIATSKLFDLAGDDAQHIVINNSTPQLHHIGKAMAVGQIDVYGDAGDYLGRDMRDGTLTVHGHAGIYAASGMSGGLLRIHGDAEDYLASATPGAMHGLRGGTVLVDGNSGHRAADRMRRGVLYIKGNTGDYCACRMLAGSVIVRGEAGVFPAFSMRRGTLLLGRLSQPLSATFNDCGVHALPFLKLLQDYLVHLDGNLTFFDTTRMRRMVGDLATNGKGEVLFPEYPRG